MDPSMHDSYALRSSGVIDIYSTEQVLTNIDLELAPVLPLQLSGFVRDRFTNGNAIDGAAVFLYTGDHQPAGRTCTDDNGFYMFSSLASGSYKLTASKDNHQTAPLRAVSVEPGMPVWQDIVLPPVETNENLIYGSVTMGENCPLDQAAVRISGPDGQTAAVTATGPDGGFAVYGLPDGQYSVLISAHGFASRRCEARVEGKNRIWNISVALLPLNAPADAAAISGFITNSQGAPIAGAWVGLYRIVPPGIEELAATETTTPDGFYTFCPVAAGQYLVKSKVMVI